jgi:Carboxypeptidase regulatory-like domain/Thioredoxin-like
LGGGDRVTTQRGAVKMSSNQPAGDCSIVIRMQSGILVLHADPEGRFSVPMPVSDRERLSVIARSADGSQMAAQEFPRPIWLRQEAAPIEVKLDRVKTISVLVSDGSGGPIPHAHAAVTEMKRGYWMFGRTPFWGDTDDSGKFTVRLPEKFQIGFVYAFKPGAGLDYRSYVAPRGNGDLHAKTPPQPDGVVRLTLAGSRRVTIKCIDESGNPVARLLVAPRCFTFTKQNETDVLGPNPSYAVTNDRGEAIFDWIPTWQQDVVHFVASPGRRLADGEQVKFDLNQSTDQFIVTIHRPVELSGTVRDAGGKPVSGAEVELSGGGYDQRRFEGHTKSDDRGRYQFEVPPLQLYMLAANSRDRRQASPVRDGIAVYPQKPVTGIDLTLAPTTRVFGRVTVGPDDRPAANYGVRATSEWLARRRIPDPDFPHGQREYMAWPDLAEVTETDSQGRFEFRLATGQYDFYTGQPINGGGMIIEPDRKLHHSVRIAGEQQVEINMHCDAPPEYNVLHGTVVDGGKPVPGALIEGASQPGPRFNAVADDHGAFEISVPDAPAVVFAKSKDGSLAGVARAGVGERNITVPIAATATCTVRLLHKDQKPYSSDRTVEYGVEIPIDPSNRRSAFREASGGKVHPDRDGRLLLPGMVVGETYKIRLQDVDSRYESRPLTTVRPQTPGDQSLPDIAFDPPPPYHRPTFEERLAETFERPMPAVQRNKEAKDFARLADARVLVTFADPQSPVTKALYKLYLDDETLPPIVNNNYLSMAIPTGGAKRAEAAALAKELSVELSGDDSPLVVAEGTDGKVLGVLTAAELVTKDKEIDKDSLLAFVKRHAPPALDARKLLVDALSLAKRENKRVLIQETAVWCGPCDRLARFLDQNRPHWEKDYIWVRMDIRWTGAAEVVKSLRGEARGGYPWLAILDADGNVLATSNKPDDGSNIGFPSQPDEIDHFLHMLKTTAQRMTADDFAQLKAALEKANREK